METRYLLEKDHLLPLLRRLRKNHRLVAPVRNRHGDTAYTEIDAPDQADIDLTNQPQSSAKSFFLPQQETLFTYQVGSNGDYGFTPVAEDCPPTIYFGLRSCDLAAILYTDVIFLRQKDPGYLRRRQETVLINLGCNRPLPTCFCNATKSGPFLEFGYDLQLTDLGSRFLVEVGRTRGRELVQEWGIFFREAGEAELKAQYQLILEAHGAFRRSADVGQAIKQLAAPGEHEEIWAELAGRCQDCGGCAYFCPTCTCFNIHDQPLDGTSGERLRTWDACTLAGFTRMAGGHDPVAQARHRLRRRFEHKLRDSVREHGRPSCVGCGRCVGACFGGVDILMFVERLCREQEL